MDHMEATLKRDICDLKQAGTLIEDVMKISQLPKHVQYACRFWVYHLRDSGTAICDDDGYRNFLVVHLLHWLEALSLMRLLAESVHLIIILEEMVSYLQSYKQLLIGLVYDFSKTKSLLARYSTLYS